MREKLFKIIDNVQKYCSHEGTYCCDCEHSRYDSESCWKYKIADAIIESGLLKDVEPFMKYWLIATTNEYADKLQSYMVKAPSESAAVYELCHNHIGADMKIINIKQIEEKTFSSIKEYEYRSNNNAQSSQKQQEN